MLLVFQYMPMSPSSDNTNVEWEAAKIGESLDEIYSAYCHTKKELHNPLLRPQWVHLPTLWDQLIQGSVFKWTGRGRREELGDKAKGGWGRIYDLSTFPYFTEKQDF